MTKPRAKTTTSKERRVSGILLSLLLGPGSGHLLRAQYGHAIAWLAVQFTLLLLAAFSPIALWVGFAGTRFASAFHYWRGSRLQRPLPTIGIALGTCLAYLCATFAFTHVLKGNVVRAFKIPSSAMVPTLHIGDHIMVNRLDVAPERGKIVTFVYPCDARKDFIKRIVAIENDTVEIRCGQLYVNDTLLPQKRLERYSYWDSGYGGDPQEMQSLLVNEAEYQIIRSDDDTNYSYSDFPGNKLPSCKNTPDSRSDNSKPVGELIESRTKSTDPCAPTRSYKVPEGHFFVLGDNRENSSDSRIWGPVSNDAIVGTYSYTWWSDPVSP